MSDIDAVHLFGIVFANELLHLKKACVTVESTTATALGRWGGNENETETPSMILYNEDFPEVNRTLVTMLAIKWVLGNDYLFVYRHPEYRQALRSISCEISTPV